MLLVMIQTFETTPTKVSNTIITMNSSLFLLLGSCARYQVISCLEVRISKENLDVSQRFIQSENDIINVVWLEETHSEPSSSSSSLNASGCSDSTWVANEVLKKLAEIN